MGRGQGEGLPRSQVIRTLEPLTLGIQAESGEELAEDYGRLSEAGRPVIEEKATTCCYAGSDKSWVSDPDGLVREAFHTTGEASVYGQQPALGALSANAAAAAAG